MAASFFFCLLCLAVALLSSSHFPLSVDSADTPLIEKLCQHASPHDGRFYPYSCLHCLKAYPNIGKATAEDLPAVLIACALSAAAADKDEAASLLKNPMKASIKKKLEGCASDFDEAYNQVSNSGKDFERTDYYNTILNLNKAKDMGFSFCVARFGALGNVPPSMLEKMKLFSDLCVDSVQVINLVFITPPPSSPAQNDLI